MWTMNICEIEISFVYIVCEKEKANTGPVPELS